MSDKDKEPATITRLVVSEDTGKGKKGDFFLSKNTSTADLKSASDKITRVSVEGRLRDANMLVTRSNLEQHFSDEYRRIKRPLLSNAFGKTTSVVGQGNLILVTSSIPGEGKTTTATNLALSIAQEKDHTVLLVDCDVDRQGISRLFGIADRPGLVDVLENDSLSIGEVLLHTDIPELCIVSAGKKDDYMTELLSSQRMSDVVAEMTSRYQDRVIIFDGPPLLPAPLAQVLVCLVGQIIFVIESGNTPQRLVEEALEMIPEDQAIGLVMNKSEGVFGRSSYYYGYYGTD